MVRSYIAFAFLSCVVSSQAVDFQPCITKMTNGCSIPLNLSFPYKDVFLPACERHDVCYQCGKTFNWSRIQCDKSFHTNMLALCKLKEDSNTNKAYASSVSKMLKAVFQLTGQLFKWLFIKSGSLEHCVHAAKIYYTAVDGFGAGMSDKADMCQLPCAKLLGDPKNYIQA